MRSLPQVGVEILFELKLVNYEHERLKSEVNNVIAERLDRRSSPMHLNTFSNHFVENTNIDSVLRLKI